MNRVISLLRDLRHNRSGLALIELAYSAPLLMTMIMGGAELTNFTTTKMRISQIALHVADNSARMGTGSLLTASTISETQINDMFTGAQLQSGKLNVLANGRIILTSVEATANPNTAGTYKIGWQRCKGAKIFTSTYPVIGTSAASNMTGYGPTGRQVTAPAGGATMFVEISYNYQPVVGTVFMPRTVITEIAAMTVRDDRDLTVIYNTANAPVASCSTYSST